MTLIEARAPGKLLLLGEYAVLAGAHAWVMAVDRDVHVRLEATERDDTTLSAPQLGIENESVRLDDPRLQATAGIIDRLGLTARLLPLLVRELAINPARLAGLAITIDSAALFETGATGPVKLGLGSSAAVTAALVVAFESWAGEPGSDDDDRPVQRLRRWLPIYRQALASAASGADLAAALAGGLHAFRDADAGPELSPLHWPEALHAQPVWVGNAAQTTDFVRAFSAWRQTRPESSARLLDAMAVLTRPDAGDDAPAWLARAKAYLDHLRLLEQAIGRPILTAPHQSLARAGQACGVVYKSCGAGGGDFGIALADDPDRLQEFTARARALGANPLQLRVKRPGASCCAPAGSFDR
ncbi:MAG: hypothetical protein RQ729_07095 [Wenzhouxiangellaceae bacterium]|nr:hypothetical protein [Wenzhouxiangellaceae bacterium]